MMFFCGQCGLQLNASDKQCPRCGTPVEAGAGVTQEDAYAQPDAPTMASPSLLGQMQAPATPPDRAGDPQKLVLRPDQNTGNPNSNYGTQGMYEATRRVELPEQGYGTPAPGAPSSYPVTGPGQPGDPQAQYSQNRGGYPPQNMYAEYPQSGSNYIPQGASYPSPGPQGYQPYPAQERPKAQNARGRTAALLTILLGLLFILVAMTLFLLERNNAFGSSYGINSGVAQHTVIFVHVQIRAILRSM
jgi:hypothetical protein